MNGLRGQRLDIGVGTGSNNEVLQLAFVSSVKLRVEDFGNLVFGFTINTDQRWRWLDVVRNGVWS